jgi:hypothetical protein
MVKYFIFNLFIYSFSLLAAEKSQKHLNITCETSAEEILSALRDMGRNDLEEYWKENSYVVDSSIKNLFAHNKDTDSLLSLDVGLLEKAKKHPNLRIAPQEELRKLGQTNALGLFAGEAIVRGQPIIEYVGQTKVVFSPLATEPKIVGWFPTYLSKEDAGLSHYNLGFQDQNLSDELWQRAKSFASSPDDLIFVQVCIDPVKRGNAARFANHSVKWANAELVVVAEYVEGKLNLHPLLVALRDINKDEEILWNYVKENDYIELKGEQLSPEYASRWLFEKNLLLAIDSANKGSNSGYQELSKARCFYNNLTSEEAKKLAIEPESYLLRQENGRFFFCANGQDFRLDENDERSTRIAYVEIEFFIINGRFTFEPKSDPVRYGNHFDKLYELRKAAKWRLFDMNLKISKRKAVRQPSL